MKRFFYACCLLLGLVLSATLLGTTAYASETEQPVAKLAGLLQQIDSLQGRFSQLTLDASGTQLQESSGTVLLKRPGMFRWQTEPPMEQELVSNGAKIWLYDPDLMQVTVQQMDERMTHTPALLLSGDLSLIEENFVVELHESAAIADFTLQPKNKDTLFDSLRLSFNNGLINDMQLVDAVGQRTSIFFSALVVNQAVADDEFVFVVPDGVDVIEE